MITIDQLISAGLKNPTIQRSGDGTLTAVLSDGVAVSEDTLARIRSAELLGSPMPRLDGVPESVTNAQLREWLIRAGKLNDLKAAIGAISNTTERAVMDSWFTHSLTVRRDSPKVAVLAAAISMTPMQVDAAFIAASKF